MKRLVYSRCLGRGVRRISTLPPLGDNRWSKVGKEIVQFARYCDTGKVAFEECCAAREQLECLVQSIGYDMNVFMFGGLVTLGIFEVGGDADFAGILDIEPELEECGVIVSRVSRELRRFGIKCRALPKARVPVVKADRTSRALPGTPLHSLSTEGIFQFSRQLEEQEFLQFENYTKDKYNASSIDWNNSHQLATIRFHSTLSLLYALTHFKTFGDVEIPLRVPVDPKNGPEIYRFPFDFCLSSTGLRNSYVLKSALLKYPYSRHILLALKKWGRESGIVNPIDGFLASYALTIMLVHFLVKCEELPKLSSSAEPISLSPNAEYIPLPECSNSDELNKVGFLFTRFLEYYGTEFDYLNSVVCTSNVNLTKMAMGWNREKNTSGRPPYFNFCIKDPFGLDNVARNLDSHATLCVKRAHEGSMESIREGLDKPFSFETFLLDCSKNRNSTRSLSERGIHSGFLSEEQFEARHLLHKVEFSERKKSIEHFGRRTMNNSRNQNVASNVTKNVLGWIKSDE